MDRSGKDSARHRTAGAQTVLLASTGQIAMFKSTPTDTLEALVGYFDDVDLLITEGYKREKKPKIEVLRAAVGADLLCRNDPGLIAVATDLDLRLDVPVFRLDDDTAIADFIEQRFLGRRG
jgi:molybdopterin-guanine dinucleotide biosynthesis protein MobB